jgi:sugar phosphate isomerase/epimerase
MTVNWVRFPAGPHDPSPPAPAWPLDTVLDGVAAAGFDAIGLDHYSVGDRDADALAAALGARGLACSDVGIVALGMLERAGVERLAAAASTLGANLCIAGLYRPLSHDDAVRDLRAATEVLAPAGIRIAFEFSAYGNATTLAQAVRLCEDVGWERCGLLVDAWHVFRGGESLADIAALEGGRIALVHVDDGAGEPLADGMYEGRFHRLLPGTGSFDLDGFFDALEAAGYDGPVCLEVLSDELRTLPPDEAAARLRRSVTRA